MLTLCRVERQLDMDLADSRTYRNIEPNQATEFLLDAIGRRLDEKTRGQSCVARLNMGTAYLPRSTEREDRC